MANSTFRLVVMLALSTAFVSSLRADPAASISKQSDAVREQAATRARKAQVEFDAVALQALIEPMMSGMKSGPLGSGQAGRYWQSLMTEHMARHLASSGRLQLLPRPPSTPGTAGRGMPLEKTPKRTETRPLQHASASPWQTDVHRLVQEGGTRTEPVKHAPPN